MMLLWDADGVQRRLVRYPQVLTIKGCEGQLAVDKPCFPMPQSVFDHDCNQANQNKMAMNNVLEGWSQT